VTLGTITQQVYRPATGYVAFGALALFVGSLAWLPARIGRPRGSGLIVVESEAPEKSE
jgi:hypothetical protein